MSCLFSSVFFCLLLFSSVLFCITQNVIGETCVCEYTCVVPVEPPRPPLDRPALPQAEPKSKIYQP